MTRWLEGVAIALGHRVQPVVMVPVRWFDALTPATQDRLVGATLFGPTATVLGIARWLTPDPSGMGTHQQLGLGGCAVLTLTGVPCPMCGMTTAFSHLAHLHLLQGAFTQPYGLLLFAATVAVATIGLLDMLLPRGRWRAALRWVEDRETSVALTLLVGMGLGWGYKVLLVRDLVPWVP